MFKSVYRSVLSALGIEGVQPGHETGHALFQSVKGVMLRVVTRETVPQTA